MEPPSGGAAKRPLTIVVVDDVAEIQLLAKSWLTDAGHEVFCADNGIGLQRILETRRVDLVITDVMMPESDGFDVLRVVRTQYPKIKIITMSGGAPVMSRDQCLHVARALGAHGVLRKPFNRAQLYAALQAVTSE